MNFRHATGTLPSPSPSNEPSPVLLRPSNIALENDTNRRVSGSSATYYQGDPTSPAFAEQHAVVDASTEIARAAQHAHNNTTPQRQAQQSQRSTSIDMTTNGESARGQSDQRNNLSKQGIGRPPEGYFNPRQEVPQPPKPAQLASRQGQGQGITAQNHSPDQELALSMDAARALNHQARLQQATNRETQQQAVSNQEMATPPLDSGSSNQFSDMQQTQRNNRPRTM